LAIKLAGTWPLKIGKQRAAGIGRNPRYCIAS